MAGQSATAVGDAIGIGVKRFENMPTKGPSRILIAWIGKSKIFFLDPQSTV